MKYFKEKNKHAKGMRSSSVLVCILSPHMFRRNLKSKVLMMALSLFVLFFSFENLAISQVIKVSFQEQLGFAYLESESLIKQWKNDELILDKFTQGYDVGEGRIIFNFDFNNMTVSAMDIINGEYKFYNEFDIIYVISPWDSETQHFSCVADTHLGDYFFEINTFETDERCLLMSYKNVYHEPYRYIPQLDWDVYNIGVVSTNRGEFKIEEITDEPKGTGGEWLAQIEQMRIDREE